MKQISIPEFARDGIAASAEPTNFLQRYKIAIPPSQISHLLVNELSLILAAAFWRQAFSTPMTRTGFRSSDSLAFCFLCRVGGARMPPREG